MGAWGMKSFDNDSALDWIEDLQELGLKGIEDTFDWEKKDIEYLDSTLGAEIIAASEVLFAIKNGPREDIPDEVLTEIEKYEPTQIEHLYAKCIKAIDRVMDKKSELFELWEESATNKDFEVWNDDVKKLKEGLNR